MGFMSIALKTSVVGGIFYYTVQEGLWSKSEESVKLYGKIYNNIAPYVKASIPKEVMDEVPHLPSTSDISYFMKYNWNKGVMTSMNFIANLPGHTCNAFNSLMKQETLLGLFEKSTEENKTDKAE